MAVYTYSRTETLTDASEVPVLGLWMPNLTTTALILSVTLSVEGVETGDGDLMFRSYDSGPGTGTLATPILYDPDDPAAQAAIRHTFTVTPLSGGFQTLGNVLPLGGLIDHPFDANDGLVVVPNTGFVITAQQREAADANVNVTCSMVWSEP